MSCWSTHVSCLIFAFEAHEICKQMPLGTHSSQGLRTEIIDNIIIIDRGRKLQYLFEGVFKMFCFFKIMLTINYITTVTKRDLFECHQKCSKRDFGAG